MNEHAGPACVLSVLIVGIFAVLLHDRERPPVTSKAVAPEAKYGTPRRRVPASPTGRASPPPHLETGHRRAPPKAVDVPPSIPGSRTRRPLEESRRSSSSETRAGQGRRRGPVPTRVDPRPRPVGPRSPFTVVQPGENLADVATRVYGSPDAKEAVWKANRDQIARIDSPLARGTLLRTP